MTTYANETKIYKDHLHTAEGMGMLRIAVELKKQWNTRVGDTDIQVGTYGVKLNLLHGEIKQKIKNIEITPIGLNNLCHNNAEIFKKCGYTSQLGFNLTACPCGRKQLYELHSVNMKDGKYYDFTKDFNDEKKKWFLPLETSANAKKYNNVYGKKHISINRGCKCPIDWIKDPDVNEMLQCEFIEHTYRVKNNLDTISVY